MTSDPVARPPRVLMLDPNSHTLPYDRALAAALADAGCAVELVASRFLYEALPPPTSFRQTDHFFRLATSGLAHRLGLTRPARLRRAGKALEYPLDWLRLLATLPWRRPHLVHVQWSLWPEFDRRLWRWLRRRGLPVVYTAHNLLPHAAASGDTARYRRLYAAADAIIVHGAATADELATRFGLPPARVHVAPHGPLLEAEPALDPLAARQRLGLPTAPPLILFTGLIEPYKGLADLVAAFAQLARTHPSAQLVVAGRPNMPVRPYRAVLAAAGLRRRAHFDLRYLPQADLAAYLRAASVVVLPYRATTTSGLLMAARRFACPVIATRVGDLAHEITDEVTGLLVPPAAPAALATALSRLLDDPAWAARLGQAGQREAMEHRGWSLAAQRTLAVYQALLAGRPPLDRDAEDG